MMLNYISCMYILLWAPLGIAQSATPTTPASPATPSTPSSPTSLSSIVHPSSSTNPSPSSPSSPSIPPSPYTYGSVIVRNNCPINLTLNSVGAHPITTPQNSSNIYDDIAFPLPSNTNFTEAIRLTCPKTSKDPWETCSINGNVSGPSMLAGQGVSLKIGTNAKGPFGDILQFEYCLDPLRGPGVSQNASAGEHVFHYDVSLLDCADPNKQYALYGQNSPLAISDVSATLEQHDKKVQNCPGYKGGVHVTFETRPSVTCKEIRCNATEKCTDIYTFDRTRTGEPSLQCNGDWGNSSVIVDLCAGNRK